MWFEGGNWIQLDQNRAQGRDLLTWYGNKTSSSLKSEEFFLAAERP
jgi:hypothetical protein